MNFTYRNNIWKDTATNSVVKSNSRPIVPTSSSDVAFVKHQYGRPNPLRHWRKQLIPTFNTPSSKQITIDHVDHANYISDQAIDCDKNYKLVKENITPDLTTCDGICHVDDNGVRKKIGGTNKIRRSGSTITKKGYYSSRSQYLKSRCKTYEQNNMKGRVHNKDKNLFKSTTCPEEICKHVVYKNSNPSHNQQGSVTASAQILKKKYDARTNHGVTMKSAYGIAPLARKPYYENTTDYDYKIYKINPNKDECEYKSCYN